MIVHCGLIDAYYYKCIATVRGCSKKETIFVKKTGRESKDWINAAFAEERHKPHLGRSYSVRSDDDGTYLSLHCSTVGIAVVALCFDPLIITL